MTKAQKNEQLRKLLRDALPPSAASHGIPPTPGTIYVPATHAKALRLDASLVVGIRGAGKSFWWTALNDQSSREALSRQTDIMAANLSVTPGFGVAPKPQL